MNKHYHYNDPKPELDVIAALFGIAILIGVIAAVITYFWNNVQGKAGVL